MGKIIINYLGSFPQWFQMTIVVFIMLSTIGVLVLLLIAVIRLLQKDFKWGKLQVADTIDDKKKKRKKF